MALALGMTVAELERRMTSAEFSEWIAYSKIEPFGERRADQRAWLLVALANNALGGERARKIDLGEVLPDWKPPPEPQTPEQVAAAVDSFFRIKMAADAAREGRA